MDKWEAIEKQKDAIIANAIIKIKSGKWTKWDALRVFTIKAPAFFLNASQINDPTTHILEAYEMLATLERRMQE